MNITEILNDSKLAQDKLATPVQTFGEFTVTIRRNASGMRAARIDCKGHSDRYIPLELLALAAGKDAWMKKIQFKCKSCLALIAADSTDGGEYCQECFDNDLPVQ